MLSSYSLSLFSATLLFTHVSLPFASAHMEMSNPLPIRSRLDPLNTGAQVDYNLKSPLNADGSNFPCRGYQNDRPIRTTATYTAGKTYQMSVAGTVLHGGGSCQLSLSYDNGATFKVIKSMNGGCPLTLQYDFTIPSYAPSGVALFAWTWFNEIGNREMYMSCAQVQIVGSSATRRMRSKRQSKFTTFSSLPNIWRANIQGIGTCSTTEGLDVVYPDPGPEVVYGGKLSSSSPVDTQTNCENTILGHTYLNLGDTSGSSSNTTIQMASPVPAPAAAPTAKTSSGLGATTTGAAIGGLFAEGGSSLTTSSISNSTVPASSANVFLAPLASNTAVISTATSTPIGNTPVTPPIDQAFNGSSAFTSYAAPSNVSAYLPCVPGAFLCTSRTTYLICDQAAGQTPFVPSSHFVGPMQVAAGMQCVPYLAKFLSASDKASFAHAPAVPAGWYRSDRYVNFDA